MSATSTGAGTRTIWKIDPSHSNISFTVRHMFTKVRGRFTDFSGTIETTGNSLTNGQVQVDIKADSIDTHDAQRDNHLRTNDFFGSDENPTITFRSTQVTPRGGNQFRITGDLTIRGVTRQVTLDAEFDGSGMTPFGTEAASWSAHTDVDRKDFNLTWNAPLETGGFLVGDDVRIQIDVEAVRQA
ncbi:MAG: YceI family protein [Thermomicrobiales bacterium]|nr:YceI family protein [Thermomicrobiales bacterium]